MPAQRAPRQRAQKEATVPCYCARCVACPLGRKDWKRSPWLQHIKNDPSASRYAEELRITGGPAASVLPRRAAVVAVPIARAVRGRSVSGAEVPGPRPPATPPPRPPGSQNSTSHQDLDRQSPEFFDDVASAPASPPASSPARDDLPIPDLLPRPRVEEDEEPQQNNPRADEEEEEDEEVDILIQAAVHLDSPDAPLLAMHSAAPGESPVFRFAYLSAAIARTFRGQTYRQAEDSLRDQLSLLGLAGTVSGPDAPAPATTLSGAMRRLHLDPDECIIPYASCPDCWEMFSPRQLTALESPACTDPDCSGIIYTEKRNAKNKLIRTPTRIVPYCSLVGTLRRMFMRPGFAAMLRDSRNDDPATFEDLDFVKQDVHHGLAWSVPRTRQKRVFAADGTYRDEPAHDDGQTPLLTSHRYGLHLTVNMDWMPLTEGRPHSAGPVYITIDDLPRSERLLQRNTPCLMISPGPKEPTAPQMNKLFKPIVNEIAALQQGVQMHAHSPNGPPPVVDVYGDLYCGACDSQARWKLFGGAAPKHENAFCAMCPIKLKQVNEPATYFEAHAPGARMDRSWLQSAYLFLLAATSVLAETLFKVSGVRWMILNYLPGWQPRFKQSLDFMHCVFLGMCKNLFKTMFAAHMVSKTGGSNSPSARMQKLLNSIMWPSYVGRLPTNFFENPTLQKADQYRRLITVSPVLYWEGWKNENDEISLAPPALPPNNKFNGKTKRRPRAFYNAILSLAVTVKTLTSCAITQRRAQDAVALIRTYCLTLLGLGVRLRPNDHWATHFDEMVERFGPIPGKWLFGAERFNGLLEQVSLNGRKGGRMELTLMRHWVRTQLFYDYIVDLPADITAQERDMLDRAIRQTGRERGSLMTQVAIALAEDQKEGIATPKSSRPFDIRKMCGDFPSLYSLLFAYARSSWTTINDLRKDTSSQPGTLFLSERAARTYPYIRKNGIRYGCATNKQTQADRLAMLTFDGKRVPAEIVWIFALQLKDEQDPLLCLAVRRLTSDEHMPSFPWDIYAEELGMLSCYADQYQDLQIVAPSSLDSPLVVIPIHSRRVDKMLWITISMDRTGCEYEDALIDDGGEAV